MNPANVFDIPAEYDAEDPAGYRSGSANVGRAAGGAATTIKLYELPPGQSVCPYHYEFEEEWLLVLSGDVVLRRPDGEQRLRAGDLACSRPAPMAPTR